MKLLKWQVNKIVSISDNADPMIKAQAHAFRDRTKMVIAYYIQEGIKKPYLYSM